MIIVTVAGFVVLDKLWKNLISQRSRVGFQSCCRENVTIFTHILHNIVCFLYLSVGLLVFLGLGELQSWPECRAAAASTGVRTSDWPFYKKLLCARRDFFCFALHNAACFCSAGKRDFGRHSIKFNKVFRSTNSQPVFNRRPDWIHWFTLLPTGSPSVSLSLSLSLWLILPSLP